MLRKKYNIQRSIRVDAQLAEDLERLSKILDRPQNELINLAIENLIVENQLWLKQFIIVDAMSGVLEHGEGYSCFNEGGLKVEVLVLDSNEYQLKFEIRDGEDYENLIDSFEKTYEDAAEPTELIEKLIQFSMYIDGESEVVKKYLQHRMNYK